MELSQIDNKKPEELESEFYHFDAANSYPTSPFKGRNFVSLRNYSTVTMVKTNIHDVNAKCASDTYSKFLL